MLCGKKKLMQIPSSYDSETELLNAVCEIIKSVKGKNSNIYK